MERAGSRLGARAVVLLLAMGMLACGGGDGTKSGPTYVKASNTDELDFFGSAVALSEDGSTMAVGAFGESSRATGIGGAQDDDSRTFAGAVYVYTRQGGRWAQQAYVKHPSYASESDYFGNAVALSADGNTLAVGAWSESSVAGAVHLYTRSGSTWTYRATLRPSPSDPVDHFGVSLAMSADGRTLAIGATGEASADGGVNGDQANDDAPWAGAVYVFTGTGATWTQQAYLKASNPTTYDSFGGALALSADGSILAVGAVGEASAARVIDPTPAQQADDSAAYAGAVYVFSRAGTTWSQSAMLKASNAGAGDQFGNSVGLTADGALLAVGAPLESSAATGVNGDPFDDSSYGSGAVYLFARSGATWTQQTYLKASLNGRSDGFGTKVSLDGTGQRLAVGAPWEDGGIPGFDGDQADESAPTSGAVYLFTQGASGWEEEHYVKPPAPLGSEYFGNAVVWSRDGSTLAVGADGEGSAATGIGGDDGDRTMPEAGAVFVY